MSKYNHKTIESKWQRYWQKHPELFSADDKSKKEKQYILDMFPYPSADGLHCGHVEGYVATDIISRYWRLKGKNVLHPQGWDAFGLPAENFAIKTKTHPAITTKRAIKNFKRQMGILGLSYDWSREINSSDPEYYKWTQWFFLLLYKNGLAYKGTAKVNWCPNCQTVLANEQAEGGVCERCGTQVVQKDMEQWFFKITDFIEDKITSQPPFERGARGVTSGLISGLDKIDWPEHTKVAQRNWIGKSEGAEFEMEIKGTDLKIKVFTTRLDTVFGMTFALIAPEHELVEQLKNKIANWSEVENYRAEAKKKSELQRMTGWEKVPPQSGEDARNSNSVFGGENFGKKTGAELKGIKIINPFTKKEIPLFISDFILAHYGTGAVMAVPGHDQRDYEFAKKFNLPIVGVIKPTSPQPSPFKGEGEMQSAFTEDGVLINSAEYDGLTSSEAREKMAVWLEKQRIGKKTINYKLRDWLVSRQRYWGAPIPIIYCAKDGAVPVPEKDLPVKLPKDVDFMPHGESPLAKSKSFHNVKCPICGAKARRESDTMDTFVCSSWYYLRYPSALRRPADHPGQAAFDPVLTRKWLPVDLYVGGAEHTVLHLLYARFFTKVLHNLGFIDFDEPFAKMRHQGIILGEDGEKMSKSRGNVVNPDSVVEQYGADALRMFEMFMGSLEDMKPWNTKGIVGISRFLERVWKLKSKVQASTSSANKNYSLSEPSSAGRVEGLLHKTIKKVSEDIEVLKFNTAISALMILLNAMEKEHVNSAPSPEGSGNANASMRMYFETFLILLSPFAPHIAEELWSQIGGKKSIFNEAWPEYDPNLVKDETIELIVQINGKVRGKFSVPAEISEDEAKKLALSDDAIKKWLGGKEPKKVIFVKGRLLNIVV